MKNIVWVIMLTAAFTTGFIACNSSTTNEAAEKQAATVRLFHYQIAKFTPV